MTDYSESFKCSAEMSRQLDILYRLHGFESKSEYIRHLITSDIQKQQGKASLYIELLGDHEGSTRK